MATPSLKKKPVTQKRSIRSGTVIAVTGDGGVKRLKVSKKKTPRAVSSSERSPAPRKLDTPPILVAVDVDAGPARVARYAGLFFMLVGACFASYSLSGMYVEVVELSTSHHHVVAPHMQQAQILAPIEKKRLTTDSHQLTSAQPAILPDTDTSTATPAPEVDDVDTTIVDDSDSDTPTHADESDDTATEPAETSTLESTEGIHEEESPEDIDVSTYLLKPDVRVLMSGRMPLMGDEPVRIVVPNARAVEVGLVPRTTLSERYLGRATRVDANEWLFTFDTTQVPNGEYALFARVKNEFGEYKSEPVLLRVRNVTPFADIKPVSNDATDEVHTQEDHDDSDDAAVKAEISNAAIAFKSSEPRTDIGDAVVPLIVKHTVPAPREPEMPGAASTTLPRTEVPPHVEQRATEFIGDIESDLDTLLELYGVALRGKDSGAIARIEDSFNEFENEISRRVESELIGEGMVANTDEAGLVRERIISLMRDERERRSREEHIIMERVGNKIQRDSDRDGISDYDEKQLYKTDPYVADTDADGFTDGAEVLSGYDPVNDVREAMVVFEDPREVGTERADLLEVTRLDVVADTNATESEHSSTPDGILLAGTALPHSFVTLYVYSTPVVVTVKTHDDGSWSYFFDKELEDGQHEVYIGVTDNAGKLVAKSKPFAFVKTAEAYAMGRVPAEPVPVAVEPSRLMSENALVLTISLVVILTGMVLVLIGAYLARREHPHVLMTTAAAVSAV